MTIKEVGREGMLTPELTGDYDLEDVREFFGLEEPDVEWYSIEEVKDV